MVAFIPLILLTATTVLLLDGIFIYGIKDHFNKQIKLVQGTDIVPDFLAIGLTYIVIISSLYYFIIKERKSAADAAFLGFSTYAIYELTTKSLLKNWSWKTVMMDTVWGATLYFLTTLIVYRFYLNKN